MTLGTKNQHNLLIKTGHIEGVSYLLLLFIAMPLKKFFDLPEAVKVMGMIHGVLFIAFMLLIAKAFFKKTIDFKLSVILFLISLIPFGTFYMEKIMSKYQSK